MVFFQQTFLQGWAENSHILYSKKIDKKNLCCIFITYLQHYSSSLSFGLFPIRGRHSRYLHFYYMAFVLRSDALPATNPLFGGKTGPPVFHIKAGASRKVPCPRAQQANLPACSPQHPLNAERQAGKL